MKKAVIGIIITIIMVIILTVVTLLLMKGCTKTKTDSSKFESTLLEKGFIVQNKINDNVSPEIKELLIANKGDDYLVEYFLFENEEFAEKSFKSRKENYSNNNNKKIESDAHYPNYDKYALTAANRYYYIARIDNTMLLVLTSENNKKEAEDIIRTLGY